MNSNIRITVKLQCVECNHGMVDPKMESLVCDNCGAQYFLNHGRPIMIKSTNELFNIGDYKNLPIAEVKKSRLRKMAKFFSPSVNLSIDSCLKLLREALRKLDAPKILVVGSGQQKDWLNTKLNLGSQAEIIYSDIDVNSFIDIFCDAHDLPFFDDSFDAVITTAVLEHVLYPEVVAKEIHRVSKINAILYSELPFMQQVHEGAYDFTRYTLSGHRRLFNGFNELASGMVAGPATALIWSIENFFLSFFGGKKKRLLMKFSIRILFFWIKYLDYWLKSRPEAMDSASCTFFMGKKVENKVTDSAIIDAYVGAKHISHV